MIDEKPFDVMRCPECGRTNARISHDETGAYLECLECGAVDRNIAEDDDDQDDEMPSPGCYQCNRHDASWHEDFGAWLCNKCADSIPEWRLAELEQDNDDE